MKKFLQLMLLAALLVPLGARAQSILLNEGFEDGIPDTWSTIHVSGSNVWEAYTANHHTGSGAVSINWASAGHNNHLVTPQLTPETGDSLVFWLSAQSYGGTTLTIEVSTTTAAENAFDSVLATYTSGSSGTMGTTSLSTFVEKKIDLSAFVGENIFISFHVVDNNGGRICIDDVAGVHMVAPTCFRVQSIVADTSSITSDGMTLSWVDTANTSTTYTLTYWPAGVTDAIDTVVETGLSGNSYELSGLEAATTYYFSIVPDCGADGSVQPRTGSAKTDCDGGSCSITVAMVDSYGDGWNGDAQLNFSQNGGIVGSAKLPAGSGNASGTAVVDVCAGIPVVFTWRAGSFDSECSYVIYDGGGAEVYNSATSGVSHSDTIANPCPSCMAPVLSVDTVTETSITVSWPSTDAQVSLFLNGNLATDSPSDTTYTFDELNSNTAYAIGVQIVCTSGDSSSLITRTVRTACGAVTTLPWSTDFEDATAGEMPSCWSRPVAFMAVQENWYSGDYDTAYYPYVYNSSYTGWPSGVQGLYFFYYDYYDPTGSDLGQMMVATPFIQHDPSDLHIKFSARINFNEESTFEAGVMTNAADTSTFIPLLTITSEDEVSGFNEYNIYTENLDFDDTITGIYVAFRFTVDGSYDYAYLDDVTVNTMPLCRVPDGGSVDSLSYDAVTLSWTTTLEADSYDVMLTHYVYNAASHDYDTVIVHYPADELSLFIDSLLPATYYQAAVAAICEDDTTAYRILDGFTTLLRCYSVQNAEVSALTANAAVITWNYNATQGITAASAIVTLVDNDDSTAAPLTQVVEGTMMPFTGLIEGHSYTATIRALCTESDTASRITLTFVPATPPCAEVDGNTTVTYVPFQGNYNYAYTQSLYDASLLDGIDTLRSLSWEVISRSTTLPNRTISIYMGYTDLTALSTSAYVPVTNLTLVADSATVNVGSLGWTSIVLDTPFVPVDTNARFVIAVVNHTGSYSSVTWGATEMAAGSSVYWYQDGAPVSPASPSATYSNVLAKVPDVRLFGNCGDCIAPSVMVNGADTASINLAWLPGGSETAWRVEYRELSDSVWTVLAANTSSATAVVTGLSAGTTYAFRVASLCSDDEMQYSAVITGATECATISVPYSANFVNSSLQLPNCWTGTNVYFASSSQRPYISYSGSYLVSPEIDDTISQIQVRINHYATSQNVTFRVGVCDADGSNVQWINTAVPAHYGYVGYDPSTYVSIYQSADVMVYLNNYSGNAKHIIIAGNGSSSSYNYIYITNVELQPIDPCLPILGGVTVIDSLATNNSVTMKWNHTATNFELQYHVYGDTVWSSRLLQGDSVVVSGLDAHTRYVGRVRAFCTDTDTSDWTATFIFSTACTEYTVPFSETFSTDMLPLCWKNVHTGNANNNTFWTPEGDYGYVYSYTSSQTQANDWLITPAITIPANTDSLYLVYSVASLDYSDYYSTSKVAYELRVSTTTDDTAAFSLLLYDTTNTDGSFEYRRIALDSFANQTVYFAFRHVGTYYSEVALNQVDVRTTLAPLYRIYGSGQVFTHDTNIYRAVRQEGVLTGMQLEWTSTMAAAGQATMVNANTDSMRIVYNVAGVDTLMFVAHNNYGSDTLRGIVRVADCPVITDFPWEEPFSDSSALACWVQEGPGEWTIKGAGSMTYPTTAHSDSLFAGIKHTDRGNVTMLISPKLNLANMSNVVLSFYHVQAEWAGDQDYLYVLGRTSATAAWDTLASYTTNIPTWRLDSVSITNVSSTYQIAFVMVDDYGYGVAIDDVTISGEASLCPLPTVTVTATGENTAEVQIEGTAASYEVAYMNDTWNEPASSTPVTTTTYTITGLTASTTYYVGVRAICSDDEASDWVVNAIVTDDHPCMMPTGVTVSGLTLDGGTISWTPGEEGQTDFQVRIYNNTYDSTVAVSNATSVTMTGLYSDIDYNVVVRAVCGDNNYSDWTEPVTLTPSLCEAPTNLTATAEGRVVTLTWQGSADRYRVVYYDEFHTINDAQHVDVEENTATVTVPEGGMDYTFAVQAYCGNALSGYSPVEVVSIVGIDAIEGSNINLYPNPAASKVTLSGISGTATVTMVDLNGRECGKWNVSDGQLTIDLTSYAKGAYFVRIAGERSVAIRKLIVK